MKKQLPMFSKNVIILSCVSFLNDIGGETIKKAIPLYLQSLGSPPSIIGLLEGTAESVPQLIQPFIGSLSDRSSKRKPFIVLGQILRSSILLLLFAFQWPYILLVRLLDRSGKGIYNAPRDALVTESSDTAHIGRSFGLTRMFDNAGAVVGLILAAIIVGGVSTSFSRDLFNKVVLFSAVPSVFAVLLLCFFVKDTVVKKRTKAFSLVPLPRKFYVFLGISVLFTLGNSSDAFLILKAQQTGLPTASLFLLVAFYSFISSVSGLPLSALSDTLGRKKLLMMGWGIFSLVYFLFARVTSLPLLIGLFALYGLYFGFTEGAAKSYIADIVPEGKKATAFGVYNLAVGVSILLASLLAGVLWQLFGINMPFYVGSGLSFLAVLSLVFWR